MPTKIRYLLRRPGRQILLGASAYKEIENDFYKYVATLPAELLKTMVPPPSANKENALRNMFMVLSNSVLGYHKSCLLIYREAKNVSLLNSEYKELLCQAGLKYANKKQLKKKPDTHSMYNNSGIYSWTFTQQTYSDSMQQTYSSVGAGGIGGIGGSADNSPPAPSVVIGEQEMTPAPPGMIWKKGLVFSPDGEYVIGYTLTPEIV